MDHIEEVLDDCPACGGDRELIGVLGNIAHCRCINCGIMSMLKLREEGE